MARKRTKKAAKKGLAHHIARTRKVGAKKGMKKSHKRKKKA